MEFGGMLYLQPSEVVDRERLEELLTYPNPAYESAARRKAWNLDRIPPTLTYIYENPSTGELAVPRNIPPDLYYQSDCEDLTQDVPLRKIRFRKTLRDYQIEFFNTTEADQYEDSIYEVSCGLGKTVMALYTIARKKQRAVIIVPTNKLMEQWYLEAKSFLRGCSIGMSDKKVETSHTQYDILILSLDLARERNLGEEFFSTFGISVWDELHRVGAQSYLPLLERCPTKHRLGLTATFRRNDSHHRVLMHHFGDVFTMRYQGEKAKVFSLYLDNIRFSSAFKGKLTEKELKTLAPYTKVHVTDEYYGYENTKKVALCPNKKLADKALKFISNPSYSSLESLSTRLPERNKQVFDFIRQMLDMGRNVLVLSKRKDILYEYLKKFKRRYPTLLVVSETAKHIDELQQSSARLILGINQIAEYGFNVPHLDTLVLLHPIKDTEQAIGRILRKSPGKKFPVAVMVTDNNLYLRKIVQTAAKQFIPFNGSFLGFYNSDILCKRIQKITDSKTL